VAAKQTACGETFLRDAQIRTVWQQFDYENDEPKSEERDAKITDGVTETSDTTIRKNILCRSGRSVIGSCRESVTS
jgi:hypothetical protein